MLPLQRRYRHFRRYREIAQVMLRHGFGSIVDALALRPYLNLPRRIVGGHPAASGRPTAAERIRKALEELGPTFIKLGQILSTRPDIVPPDFMSELARLQDEVPAAPWDAVREIIESELGRPIESAFASIEPEPIAAASLGQVHLAELLSGESVVVKVQRPHIDGIIHVDLEVLMDLATLAEQRTALGQIYDLRAITEDFGYTLRSELDYRREGRNADRFRAMFEGEPTIHFPLVYWDYSSRRVLTLERVHGIKIDDIEALDAAGLDRREIAGNAARIMIREVFEFGFFHADPHPGNFFVQDDGSIAAVDFGMVGHLTDRDKVQLGRLFVSAVRGETHAVVEELIRMGSVTRGVERESLARDLDRLLAKYTDLSLQELTAQELFDDVLPVAFRHRVRLPSQLWLLAKTLVMMEGLGLRLDPEFQIFETSKPYVAQMAARLGSPQALLGRAAEDLSHWVELFRSLPETMPRLLDKAEAGKLELQTHIPEIPKALRGLDRIANRLAVSMLVSAFIVAMALLLPTFVPLAQSGWGGWLILLGLLGAGAMGLWLLYQIWRSGR